MANGLIACLFVKTKVFEFLYCRAYEVKQERWDPLALQEKQ